MRKIYAIISALIISTSLFGQSPSSFKYQAVLRNFRGDIRANVDATIVIDITKDNGRGDIIYSESHKVKTDNFGLIDLEIGQGTPITGIFSDIDWGKGTYFVKIIVDGVEMGTAQLHSVPYALYSEKAGNGFSGSYNDLSNKPILFDGTWLSLTGKPTFATVATSGKYGDLTEKPLLFDGTWSSLTGKPTFALVATTGSYTSLTNLPALTNGTVTSVTATTPLIVTTGNTTPVISMVKASGTTDGYLSSTDWTKFNNTGSFDGTWSTLSGKPTTVSGYGITDAMTTLHAANGITSANITNWDIAYGWGNHSGLYRLISYVPTWSEVTGKPTTIAGFGITDAFNGTWASLTGKPTFATVATSGSYDDLSNKPTIDGSETKVTAGTNVTVTGTGTSASPYIINTTAGATTHYIGELYAGGVIFWVDQTGNHGLICSMIDLSTSQEWSNVSTTSVGTTAQSDWDGLNNSNAIVGQIGHTGSAAKICLDYVNVDYGTGVYNDWYLPAIDQLSLLYNGKYQVHKTLESDGNSSTKPLIKESYWTSTEYSDIDAITSDYSLDIFPTDKTYSLAVRAIRSF